MLGYLNEHLQLKRQALNAYQRLDIGDVLLPGFFFFKPQFSTIPSIHLSFSQSCWIASAQLLKGRADIRSWQLRASSVVSTFFLLLLFVEQKTEQTSSHSCPCVFVAVPQASGTRPCAFTIPPSRRSPLTCAAWLWPAAARDSSPRASVVRTVTVHCVFVSIRQSECD